MKYLKKFENDAAYQAYVATDFAKPNVSICVQENHVHYNPYVDPCEQHEYVEIGGVKWATKNVGACNITDYGLHFQWGDVQGYTAEQVGSGDGQKYFGWEDYIYWTSDTGSGSSGLTKYNATDGKTALDASDDAATAAWGGNWRMPTIDEFESLIEATTSALTTDYQGSGVSGVILTDKIDVSKVLFFPFGGQCVNGLLKYVGSSGYYWTSTLYEKSVPSGWDIFFGYSQERVAKSSRLRRMGDTIRLVRD